ncbi:MAG: hypothetical protein J1F67_11635 [Muribaculaceae bacterium]|nr:hypothetical protein [Muribaculaceae bacterium]
MVYYESREENGDALSFEYKPNSHWAIEAGWYYMFRKKEPNIGYGVFLKSTFFREIYIKNNANVIVISVSYNPDFISIFHTGKRSLNNSDNSSSLFTM